MTPTRWGNRLRRCVGAAARWIGGGSLRLAIAGVHAKVPQVPAQLRVWLNAAPLVYERRSGVALPDLVGLQRPKMSMMT